MATSEESSRGLNAGSWKRAEQSRAPLLERSAADVTRYDAEGIEPAPATAKLISGSLSSNYLGLIDPIRAGILASSIGSVNASISPIVNQLAKGSATSMLERTAASLDSLLPALDRAALLGASTGSLYEHVNRQVKLVDELRLSAYGQQAAAMSELLNGFSATGGARLLHDSIARQNLSGLNQIAVLRSALITQKLVATNPPYLAAEVPSLLAAVAKTPDVDEPFQTLLRATQQQGSFGPPIAAVQEGAEALARAIEHNPKAGKELDAPIEALLDAQGVHDMELLIDVGEILGFGRDIRQRISRVRASRVIIGTTIGMTTLVMSTTQITDHFWTALTAGAAYMIGVSQRDR